MLNKVKSKEWEIKKSTLGRQKNSGKVTYQQCRDCSCYDIIKNLTHIETKSSVTELPRGTRFNFLVRVDTKLTDLNNPKSYYEQFNRRNFISFSTISNKNVSYYGLGGKVLFAYEVKPNSIAHVFPMDCDSNPDAETEDDITELPSLWLTLKELNEITGKLKTYNQITCKTKEDGKILKPCAIIAIDRMDSHIKSVALKFGIRCIIVHPEKSAICETFDPFFPLDKEAVSKTKEIFRKFQEIYSINLYERY